MNSLIYKYNFYYKSRQKLQKGILVTNIIILPQGKWAKKQESKMTAQSIKQSWNPSDTIKLVTLYHMGVRKEELSEIFERSPASIRKKVDRLKIRPQKSSSFKLKIQRFFPDTCSIDVIRKSYAEFYNSKKEYLSSSSLKSIKKFILGEFPLHKEETICKDQVLNTISKETIEDLGLWMEVSELVKFLNSKGCNVEKAAPTYLKGSGNNKYLLDGQLCCDTALLVKANTMAAQCGSPKLYVEGITQALRIDD